ncbi:putative N-acetylated-alpha-linked acidic dipeptidase [Penaeus chinensis]|uniref:putative N-acetylated-alpha-linked acidic dipeptidase n=1 Tax=Penaeus chinensis TaxID=139456 RepID=UPI001FB6395F|nr:putative N-acetylated-alpha-linked acidic dipeptidase [Penaeus chinensis]
MGKFSFLTGCLAAALGLTIALGLVILFATSHMRNGRSDHEEKDLLTLEDFEDYIMNNVDPQSIRQILRNLTTLPHLGGTAEEWQMSTLISDTWRQQGMDEVHMVPYEVLLSYPSKEVPNLVRLVDQFGGAAWTSAAKQKPLYSPEESNPDVPFTFNGYAAPGNVTGDVVYVNYGRSQDFETLSEKGINLEGKIVIARYGRIFRANIAQMAEGLGAVGLVLFSDPSDFAPEGPEFVYPRSSFLPPTAAPFGTVKLVDGDPLTPFYPATKSAFHIPMADAPIPTIPVQPIGYEDAWQILSRLGGPPAPGEWQGGLNITYNLGPGFSRPGWKLNLDVNNNNTHTTTYNVIGVIKGRVEPDRYVLLGNHIDAWIFGGLDPNSGTAAMLELSRVLTNLVKEKGWRPRRSLVFCAWGAEEYGLVGSLEWTEQFGKQLADRAVAYLNVDMAIEGNYTLRTKSAPLLYQVIYESARRIPNPDPEEAKAGRLTVYDTWALRKPDPVKANSPLMQFIGSGSDYKGFQHNLGIPCMDTRYTHSDHTLGEPQYHTLYETFALVDEIYDRGFHFHKAVTALWGHITLRLSEPKILPFSLDAYATFLSRASDNILEKYGDLISSQNITMDYFTAAVQKFNSTTVAFNNSIEKLDLDNPLAVRHVNDQLMMVERAFIDARGLPGRPDYNHVVTAPSKNDAYSGTAFAGLSDTLCSLQEAPDDLRPNLWVTFSQHLAAVTHVLETASRVLTDDLW